MATRRRSEHTQGLKLAISLADFLQLAYGDNCDLTDTVLPTIRRVVSRDTVETIADLRGIIMSLDQQRFPTQISIRFSESDIQFVTINGVECAVDRQDLSVCAPAAS